jgi:hypothetical protein
LWCVQDEGSSVFLARACRMHGTWVLMGAILLSMPAGCGAPQGATSAQDAAADATSSDATSSDAAASDAVAGDAANGDAAIKDATVDGAGASDATADDATVGDAAAEGAGNSPATPDASLPVPGDAGPDGAGVDGAQDDAGGACVTAMGEGGGFSCAVRSDATLWCWGRNDYGQSGDPSGSDPYVFLPRQVATPVPVRAVNTGVGSSCALGTDGSVMCWGDNSLGELGNGTTNGQASPVVTIPSGVTALSSGYAEHTCAIETDGSLWCWGVAYSETIRPTKVEGLPGPVTYVAVGNEHTCAISSDTSLWCWGGNSTGSNDFNDTPQQVTAIGTGVVQVAAGYFQTCAVKQDGTLWCWGDDPQGGTSLQADGGASAPTQIVALGSDVREVRAGEHYCARKADGSVWCWGANGSYECGNTGNSGPTPIAVAGLADATAVSVGNWSSCALTADAVMRCWGDDGYGQFGTGSNEPSTPTPTAPLLPCP